MKEEHTHRLFELILAHAEGAKVKPLPSVQPIRPKGKWLFKETTNAYYVTGQCSRCTQRNRINNFCPNCGADMRGE